MKITFLIPPLTSDERAAERTAGCTTMVYPMINIYELTIAAILEKEGYDVYYQDFITSNRNLDQLRSFLREDHSDIYIFWSVNLSIKNDVEVSQLIHESSPQSYILYLGPAPTLYIKEFLQDDYQIVVRGEPDITVKELCGYLEGKKDYTEIKGISFLNREGKIQNNPPRELLRDLDSLPFPSRHLIDKKFYSNPKLKRSPYTAMVTSRNCPFHCIYCVPSSLTFARELENKAHTGKKPFISFRSVENVVEEIESLAAEGYKAIGFLDDNFITTEKRLKPIAQALNKHHIIWGCQARADAITENIAAILGESGCKYIDLGVESFNDEILKYIKKGVTREQIITAIHLLNKYNVPVKLNILIGTSPLETKQTIKETLDTVIKLKADQVMINIVAPFPGTEFYDLAKKNQWIVGGEYIPTDVQHHSILSYPNLTNKEMEDLVVLGYGPAVERKSLTAAVGSASGDQLRERPTNNVAEALSGQIAGLSVTATDGSPDAEIQLRIRGASSVTQGSEPLYIVDGMPVSSIADIPASVIQSVDVLKDASATAIYGARGANGVVLITTKDPSVGDKSECNSITVDYAGSYGVKWLADELPLASSRDYVLWQYERAKLLTKDDADKFNSEFGKYFNPEEGMSFGEMLDHYTGVEDNWQDAVFGRTGHTINNSLTISGGSKALNYSLNYSRLDDKAIMKGSGYTKDYLQFKLTAQPIKSIKLGATIRYSDTKTIGSGANDANSNNSKEGRLKHTLLYTPIPMAMLAANMENDPDLDPDEVDALRSPLVKMDNNYKENTKRAYTYQGYLSWQIIKGLTFRTEGAYDMRTNDTYHYYGEYDYKTRSNGAMYNVIMDDYQTSYKYRNTNTLSFEKKRWKENHNVSVVLGEEMIFTDYHTVSSEIHDVPKNYGYKEANSFTSLGNAIYFENTYPLSDKLVSFFGRANYDYKSRYLFSATLRADGSSK